MPAEPPVASRPSNCELARALGVHRSQIGRWEKMGCPLNSVEAVQKWRQEQPQRTSESQKRANNKHGLGNSVAKRAERMGLSPTQKYAPKMTPELVEKVAECILYGFNYEETALLCDLSPKTLRNWRNIAVIQKAISQQKRSLIDKVIHGTRPDWARLCWFLERRWPLEFSRPEVAHAIRVSNQTTNVTNNLVISSEIAKELTARSKSVRAEVEKLFSGYTAQGANQPQALPNRDDQGADAS